METNRRKFLSATLSIAVGGALTLFLACRREGDEVESAKIELVNRYVDRESVEMVGREAIEVLPEGSDADLLLERIAPERGSALLKQEIRRQHEMGEVVRLRGWTISLTEARMFALVALSAKVKN